jgi:23S rRNA pseudouridine1911/1915/1917 synthase
MMFAKNKDFQTEIQRRWHENVTERKYVALVEGTPDPKKGRIVSYLSENPKSLKMHSDNRDNGGQKAVTTYRLLSSNGAYSLLEISLETGRKNQIRVHMQQIGHSVAGDKKYGGSPSPVNRLGLHASVLAWRHPFTDAACRFESPVPKKFTAFIGFG